MSKIDDLIKELCPNGVMHKALWSLTTWDKRFNAVDNHKQPKVKKYFYFLANDLKPLILKNGDIKILTTSVSNIYTSSKLVDSSRIAEGEVVCIPWGGNPIVQYYNGKFITADNRICFSNDDTYLSNKYLYYVLTSKLDEIKTFYRGSGIKHPNMQKVLDLKIPVPPLEIQKEIVRVLDSFTELEAELEARKKQYEYYRNTLLTFNERERVEYVQIGDICNISRGRVMSKSYLIDNAGDYPVYSSQTANNGVFGYINTYDYDKESITWTTDGANAGSVFYHNNEEFSITNVCGLLMPKREQVKVKYLYYILQITLKKYVNSGMGNPKLMSNTMAKIKIPVSSLEKQKQIVSILDKFEKLTNDISVGLPAEIEARRKQYEYYRNKLLTFKELEHSK